MKNLTVCKQTAVQWLNRMTKCQKNMITLAMGILLMILVYRMGFNFGEVLYYLMNG